MVKALIFFACQLVDGKPCLETKHMKQQSSANINLDEALASSTYETDNYAA